MQDSTKAIINPATRFADAIQSGYLLGFLVNSDDGESIVWSKEFSKMFPFGLPKDDKFFTIASDVMNTFEYADKTNLEKFLIAYADEMEKFKDDKQFEEFFKKAKEICQQNGMTLDSLLCIVGVYFFNYFKPRY